LYTVNFINKYGQKEFDKLKGLAHIRGNRKHLDPVLINELNEDFKRKIKELE
jgi:hypothetical protein